MWCECPEMEKENAFGTTFYKDGEHPELRKHHYRCNKCGKVTQIG
jgi:Fe2+ or Zn2+ uptake regulation protein